jgi:hypothetical protein
MYLVITSGYDCSSKPLKLNCKEGVSLIKVTLSKKKWMEIWMTIQIVSKKYAALLMYTLLWKLWLHYIVQEHE